MTVEAAHERDATDLAAPIEALRTALRGHLLQPTDADYDRARLIWNGMFDKKPAFIARCNGTADVIDAVNFARETGLLTAVRCGGHNSSGSGSSSSKVIVTTMVSASGVSNAPR